MVHFLLDENDIRKLSLEERYEHCSRSIRENDDPSFRWDNIWLSGEIIQEITPEHKLYKKLEELYAWNLEHDDNPVVKHETCYQIAGHDMRNLIPVLIKHAKDESQDILTRHEAIEALGLMRAYEAESIIKEIAQSNSDPSVTKTAEFVLMRFNRLKKLNTPYIPAKDLY